MIVLVIAIFVGLFIFFLGLSLLMIHNQNKEKEDCENSQLELPQESLQEEYRQKNDKSKSYTFAVCLGAEGLILSIVALMATFVHQFVIKINILVSIPVLVVYLLSCFVINALRLTKE